MALKKCPDCGNQISTKAEKCLQCGRAMIYWTPGRILLGLLIVFVGVGYPAYCFKVTISQDFHPTPAYTTSYSTPNAQSTPQLSPEEAKTLDKVKAKIEKDYPDDYTTQKFAYEEQVKAYKYMKLFPASKLKSKVEKEFPYDFTTQKFVYDQRVEAKQEMDKK